MKLEELLEKENLHHEELRQFMVTRGIKNITTEELDRLISSTSAIRISGFDQWYNIVSTNEANKTMKRWTRTSGIFTIIVTALTAVNVIILLAAP